MNDTRDDPRRWRTAVLVPAAGAALVLLVGFLTKPTDAELLERARTAGTHGARCRAMNALVLRGYWEAREGEELRRWLRDAPPDLAEYVRDAHGVLLGR